MLRVPHAGARSGVCLMLRHAVCEHTHSARLYRQQLQQPIRVLAPQVLHVRVTLTETNPDAATCSNLSLALARTLIVFMNPHLTLRVTLTLHHTPRFYLIDNGVIEHIPMPTNGAYNPLEIDQWLDKKLAQS